MLHFWILFLCLVLSNVALGQEQGQDKSVSDSDCFVRPVRISGSSMSPLIANGSVVEMVFGDRQCLADIKKRDIVLYNSGADKLPLIKMVKAVAGDSFSVDQGKIIVNGEILRNSQGLMYNLNKARARVIQMYVNDYKGIIPKNAYLVLGDNTRGTKDSSRFGLVHQNDIIAKMQF